MTSPLTFTSGNWSTPQTVTITGVNDADAVNETVTISHALSGGGYNAVTMTNFTATMTDDEVVILGVFFNGKTYLTVTSATGRVWLDRNLGATQVATSSTDSAAYGHLYQWGRNDDGHESRSSATTATLATAITPGTNTFITINSSPHDWTTADRTGSSRTNAWNSGGTNDICPVGFSVPLESELEAERASWATNNASGAYGSNLKIPVAGYRHRTDGRLGRRGEEVHMWSRSAGGTGGRHLDVYSHTAYFNGDNRAHGFSIRCIKD
ncbi:hypothetical protein CRYPA_155 [uncultured Candidatus Thioglobus sp.]|nr:hypothetical protein CRYPA_155 [uncultured Candidatus Thioglobus sp.]